MDRGAWRATVHRVAKESDTTEVTQHTKYRLDRRGITHTCMHTHTHTHTLVRWMNPEHSEGSKKEKNKYHILTHIYGIQNCISKWLLYSRAEAGL